MDLSKVLTEASVQAFEASSNYFQDVLGGQDQMMCGFAWINVKGVRKNSKIGKQLLEAGFRRDDYDKCLTLWNPAKFPCQNIDTLYSGALAYAKVLQDAGIDAIARSRLD